MFCSKGPHAKKKKKKSTLEPQMSMEVQKKGAHSRMREACAPTGGLPLPAPSQHKFIHFAFIKSRDQEK